MKDCSRFENSIQALITGDPQLEQLEELVAHCKTCRTCRELFEMHRTLVNFGSKFDELEAFDLSEVRASIVQKVTAQRKPRSLPGWITALRTPLNLQPITAVLVLVIFFAFGLVSSRLSEKETLSAKEMTAEILSANNSGRLQNSYYSFTNVAVTPLDDNKVALSFDITKRVEIVDSTQSKVVKGVLMHALRRSSPTGAVGYFRNTPVEQPAF